jgi:DNA uptake protein ComE-like DNA-binding protein
MSRVVRTIAIAIVAAAPLTAQVGAHPSLVEPNVATEQQLAAVPGFTPAIVKAVVEGRPWLSQAAFDAGLAKAGLTAEQRKAAYARTFVHLDLNATTKEEILMIPGVGAKMLHEFEEYRPYRNLAHFRREIGKYVKADELARLEGYVFVPMELNSATDADFLTIPGLGQRMLREFKEYRPYADMARFSREIGKYVKPTEVQRLARYVTVAPAARK